MVDRKSCGDFFLRSPFSLSRKRSGRCRRSSAEASWYKTPSGFCAGGLGVALTRRLMMIASSLACTFSPRWINGRFSHHLDTGYSGSKRILDFFESIVKIAPWFNSYALCDRAAAIKSTVCSAQRIDARICTMLGFESCVPDNIAPKSRSNVKTI